MDDGFDISWKRHNNNKITKNEKESQKKNLKNASKKATFVLKKSYIKFMTILGQIQ